MFSCSIPTRKKSLKIAEAQSTMVLQPPQKIINNSLSIISLDGKNPSLRKISHALKNIHTIQYNTLFNEEHPLCYMV